MCVCGTHNGVVCVCVRVYARVCEICICSTAPQGPVAGDGHHDNRVARIMAAVGSNPQLQQHVILRALQLIGAHPRPSVLPRETHHAVPSISELSSQSSDEDTAGRRRGRREGGSSVVPTSSLVTSTSSASQRAQGLREQELSQTDSSGGETTATELAAVVPDPETLRRLYLERADRTVARVPKIPSQLKKSVVRPLLAISVLLAGGKSCWCSHTCTFIGSCTSYTCMYN